MTINVTITADTTKELHSELWALLNGSHPAPATSTVPTPVVTVTPVEQKVAEPEAPKRGRGRPPKAEPVEPVQYISTGEERVDPATEAEVAQDAADEAADTAAEKVEPAKLTHDDVKKMLSGYVQAYGMAAVQVDGAGMIGADKVSSIPDDQKALAEAVIGIAKAIEGNPNKRDMSGEISPEKMAEMKALVASAQATLK
jgi:hypothetical protein